MYNLKNLYNITLSQKQLIGDKIFFIPYLHLDHLKVTDLKKVSTKKVYSGSYNNTKIGSQVFGENYQLTFEEGLLSDESFLFYNSQNKKNLISTYLSLYIKCLTANEYGEKNYTTKAKPSPKLTQDEISILFQKAEQVYEENYFLGDYSKENSRTLLKRYYNRPEALTNFNAQYSAIESELLQALEPLSNKLFETTSQKIEKKYLELIEQNFSNNEIIIKNSEQNENFLISQQMEDLEYTLYLDKNFNIYSSDEENIIIPKGQKYYIKKRIYQPVPFEKLADEYTFTIQPNNEIYSLIGTGETTDGRQFQVIFPEMKIYAENSPFSNKEPALFSFTAEPILANNTPLYKIVFYEQKDNVIKTKLIENYNTFSTLNVELEENLEL